jgi:hypothetical protein
MVEAVLEGIERERPKWTVLLQVLQGGLTGRQTIADIQPDLVRLKVKLRRTADSGHRAVAMRANAAGSQTSDQQALEAKVEQLSAQLRTRAFGSYRKFARPLVVHFAKKGTTAHAVGVDKMLLSGCSGHVVLPEVLHVPALQDPLFAVRAALSRRMSVHFCPKDQPDSLDDVIITHYGRLCLTGRMYSGLYFLDEHPSAAATLTATPPSL